MFKIDNKDTEITSLYNHWKYQKTRDFLMFSGGIDFIQV